MRSSASNEREEIRQRLALLFPHLNERQRHLVAAAEAIHLGRGGISLLSQISGYSRPTLYKAIRDLRELPLPPERLRAQGGGRKRRIEQEPGLLQAIEDLMFPGPYEDDCPVLRWTCKGTRDIVLRLTQQGQKVSHGLVAQLLRQLGYMLPASRQKLGTKQDANRNEQFRETTNAVKRFLSLGHTVVAINAVSEFIGEASSVEARGGAVEDLAILKTRSASASTNGQAASSFRLRWIANGAGQELATLRTWWKSTNQTERSKVLVCVASSILVEESQRAWQIELQRWANEAESELTTCYLPPATFRWTSVTDRLRSTSLVENACCRPVKLRLSIARVATPQQ
jgi:hypothetical protein